MTVNNKTCLPIQTDFILKTNVKNKIANDLLTEGISVYPDFISPQFSSLLCQEVRDFWHEGLFHQAGTGQGKDRRVKSTTRSDQIMWLVEGAMSTGLNGYLSIMEGLQNWLNRQLLLGLFELETMLAIYPAGGFYRRHLDQFNEDDSRILTVILYLNNDWRNDHGGQLRVYRDDVNNGYMDVQPIAGKLVVFLSSRFEHEVLPAQRERISITGWFKKRVLNNGISNWSLPGEVIDET